MANQLCFRCFKMKGDYEVCPYCGYAEDTKAEQVYQLSPGTVLRSRYIIGTSIGFGGFGITYKAFDTSLSLVVAIKEFYPAGLVNRGEGEVKVGIFSGDKESDFKRQLERFLEEARNMAIFSKEKDIINVYDYFEENQTAYIIMEYVDAPLLKARLKEEGRLPVDEAKGYMTALLDALSKVHRHGIIHKDISPDNIFLTGKNTVKIFDFGAAKFQGTETERTEAVVVKAGYTPPEQYRSKNEQGAFMDIYAAGAVFYEMITGEKPMDAPDRAVEDELKKPSEFDVAVDDKLERVILKSLALKPELRFQTAEQFSQAIVSEKKVELPEEEILRHQRKKKLLTASLAAVFLIIGGMILLSQTIFSGRGKLDVAGIHEDTLEIWLVAEKEAEEELIGKLLESVKKECPKLTVTVKAFGQEEYAKKLQSAIDGNSLPDVFCTDTIDAGQYCTELGKLLNTMKLPSYLYLNDWKKENNLYELPTAMQAGIAYINMEKEKELPESLELNGFSLAEDTLGYGNEKEIFVKFKDMQNPISVIAGDLSDMDSVKEVTIDQIPPTDFCAVPLLKDGKLTGNALRRYGVNKEISENKQEAGMFLISLLLSDGMQSAAYMDNEEGIPLNRTALSAYRDNKMTAYLEFLKSYDLEDTVFFEGTEMSEILKEQIEGSGK